MKKFKIYPTALLMAIILVVVNCNSKTHERPNIILIMTDDMGYSDIGCYGGEIITPNIDNLAENGLRLTQFYNSARCCPTRASLLTGLYPHQTGIGLMTNPPGSKGEDLGLPAYRGKLNQSNVTLAEVLKMAGYRTYMTGKWHLGVEQENHPIERGFDKFYGLIAGASNHFKPEGARSVWEDKTKITVDDDFYTTDNFTEKAIEFINNEESDEPFFLYLAYTAPHWPLHAPAEEIEKYKGRYSKGWEPIRQERYRRMKKMGLIDSNWGLSPLDAASWEKLDDDKRKLLELKMEIYAAMITRVDANIGNLANNLKKNGQWENTVIIFMNDNGACAEGGNLGWGKMEHMNKKEGYWISYGKSWANASNTPYRQYKHYVHEGGIGTPFIVHWPEGIAKNKKGGIVHSYGFLPDIMATFIDLAQTTYPETYEGKTIAPQVGKSILPLLKEDKQIHVEPIFFEHQGNKAVRLGDYKLVCKWNPKNEDTWELYNLKEDRTETKDLSELQTGKFNELKQYYETWASENGVLPRSEIKKIQKEKKEAAKKIKSK